MGRRLKRTRRWRGGGDGSGDGDVDFNVGANETVAVAAAMAAAMVTWTLTWEDSSTWQEGRCENGPSEPCWDCVHKPLHMCNRP